MGHQFLDGLDDASPLDFAASVRDATIIDTVTTAVERGNTLLAFQPVLLAPHAEHHPELQLARRVILQPSARLRQQPRDARLQGRLWRRGTIQSDRQRPRLSEERLGHPGDAALVLGIGEIEIVPRLADQRVEHGAR